MTQELCGCWTQKRLEQADEIVRNDPYTAAGVIVNWEDSSPLLLVCARGKRGAVETALRRRSWIYLNHSALEAIRVSVAPTGENRTTMVSAFTPLIGASLLHVAAEYGHLRVARKLLELGAKVDARAAQDSVGFGGQTPLFHTVNSHENRSEPVMRLLLEAGARADILLAGITWGKDMEWETECFDVTPVSYAQLGLLRQFQRSEEDIYSNIRTLLAFVGRELPKLGNIPNRYLYK